MAEEEKKKSFWETLPGIITAIAALITAIAALVAAMNGVSKEKPEAPAAAVPPQIFAPPANDEAAELKRKLSEIAAAKAKAEAEAAAAKARAEEAERHAAELERKKAEPQQGDIITDTTTGMELVYVPGGCFQMGSPENEESRDSDEKLHEVCVDGFWMGKTEVTQGQWKKIMGGNPAKFQKGDDYPVEQVSWDDAQDFIKKLNSKAGKKYRLPTEAEWEYAARAGTSTARFWGDSSDEACSYANVADQTAKKKYSDWTIHSCDDGYAETAPAGSFQANPFGLHDMLGNVWEWCAGWYGEYELNKKENPLGASSGSYRVIRGGCWYGAPEFVRAADRIRFTPDSRDDDLGFRLLLSGQQGQAGR